MDISTGWKLVTLGCLTTEQGKMNSESPCLLLHMLPRMRTGAIDHMPFSPVPPITWPPCSLAFGCALSPNQEFIIQCLFFFFLRFLGRDKEINILEMWYHVENILQEAAVSPDDC